MQGLGLGLVLVSCWTTEPYFQITEPSDYPTVTVYINILIVFYLYSGEI